MAILLFANNAATTLQNAIGSGDVTCTVAPGTGALFPNPGAGQFFTVTFVDAATGLLNEIVSVTAVVGDVFTITRAQEGTTAQSWSAGDFVNNFWTAGSAAAMLQQGQQQQQSTNYAVDTGAVNVMVITLSPAPSSMTQLVGSPLKVKVNITNTNATPTLNVNGLGAFNVVTMGTAGVGILGIGTAAASKVIDLVWDGTNFQYQNRVITASSAQIVTGTDVISPITSAGLAAAMPHSTFNFTSGYQQFPSGFIVQWGVFTAPTGNGDALAMPVTFPNRGVSIVANAANYAGTTIYIVTSSFTNNSTGAVSVFNTSSIQTGIVLHWCAFGY